MTHLRKKINVTVIVGFFYPFYIKEADKFGVGHLFKDLLSTKGMLDFREYVAYIKKLASKYHDNIALDQEHLLKLLSEIIKYFEVHGKKITDEENEMCIAELKKELF